jgi:WD40 repeat protein
LRAERGRPILSLLAVTALLASGCVAHPSIRQPHGPPLPALKGRLLIGQGENFNEVWSYRLPSGRGTPFQGAQFGESRFLQGAAVQPGGRAFVMVQRSGYVGASLQTVRSQLYELGPGESARAIGPPFVNGSLLGLRGNTAIATACGARHAIFALDIERHAGWRRVAPGSCTAALSPNHARVAYARAHGRDVWAAAIGGGRPDRVVKLSDVPGLEALGIGDPRAAGLAWGRPGLAVLVTQGHQFPTQPNALLIVEPDRKTRVVGLGTAVGTDLAWQPHGSLLAFTNYSLAGTRFFGLHPEGGDLRVYDPASGRLRQLAASPTDFEGLQWSPDGTTLVTGWSQSKLLFVDPSTGAIRTHDVEALPIAWEPT